MNLSEHIKHCQNVLDKYGDLDVIYGIDESDYHFNPIEFEPTVGHYDSDDKEFTDKKLIPKFVRDELGINAICIN